MVRLRTLVTAALDALNDPALAPYLTPALCSHLLQLQRSLHEGQMFWEIDDEHWGYQKKCI